MYESKYKVVVRVHHDDGCKYHVFTPSTIRSIDDQVAFMFPGLQTSWDFASEDEIEAIRYDEQQKQQGQSDRQLRLL